MLKVHQTREPAAAKPSRRAFLGGSAAGAILLGFHLDAGKAVRAAGGPDLSTAPPQPNASTSQAAHGMRTRSSINVDNEWYCFLRALERAPVAPDIKLGED